MFDIKPVQLILEHTKSDPPPSLEKNLMVFPRTTAHVDYPDIYNDASLWVNDRFCDPAISSLKIAHIQKISIFTLNIQWIMPRDLKDNNGARQ